MSLNWGVRCIQIGFTNNGEKNEDSVTVSLRWKRCNSFVSCFDSINSILSVKASSFVSWSHPLLTNPFETFDKLTLFERFDNGTPNMVDMKNHDVIPSNTTSPHRENNNYHGYNPLPLSVLHNVHNGPPPILEKGNSNIPHLNKVKVSGITALPLKSMIFHFLERSNRRWKTRD